MAFAMKNGKFLTKNGKFCTSCCAGEEEEVSDQIRWEGSMSVHEVMETACNHVPFGIETRFEFFTNKASQPEATAGVMRAVSGAGFNTEGCSGWVNPDDGNGGCEWETEGCDPGQNKCWPTLQKCCGGRVMFTEGGWQQASTGWRSERHATPEHGWEPAMLAGWFEVNDCHNKITNDAIMRLEVTVTQMTPSRK